MTTTPPQPRLTTRKARRGVDADAEVARPGGACKEGNGSGRRREREKEGGGGSEEVEKGSFKDASCFQRLNLFPPFSTHLVVRLQERPGSVDDGVDGEAMALRGGLNAFRGAPRGDPDGILVTIPSSSSFSSLPSFLHYYFPPLSPPFRPLDECGGGPVLEQASPVLLGLLRSSDPGAMARSSHSTVATNAHGSGNGKGGSSSRALRKCAVVGASFVVASRL